MSESVHRLQPPQFLEPVLDDDGFRAERCPPAGQRSLGTLGADRSAAGRMLTIASQFDLVSCLLAVVAAIFSVRAMRRHLALTHKMGAFRFDIGHKTPPPRHSAT